MTTQQIGLNPFKVREPIQTLRVIISSDPKRRLNPFKVREPIQTKVREETRELKAS